MSRPVVVFLPGPHPSGRIFAPQTRAALEAEFDVIDIEGRPDRVDASLADAIAIIGQPDLPRERLDAAPHLRAVMNVEGNFYPNVDYATCFARGVHVLGCRRTRRLSPSSRSGSRSTSPAVSRGRTAPFVPVASAMSPTALPIPCCWAVPMSG